MPKYLMALDSGTTSARCLIFDSNANVVSMSQRSIPQYFPQPGWVEQDANEIWARQLSVCVEAMQKQSIQASDIAGIGITNQRESVVVWDRNTGDPIAPVIVWQCRRTAAYCEELEEQGYTGLFHQKTGLLLDAYFSGTKLKWILDNTEGARQKAENGDLLFGTIDSWLVYKLSGGRLHITDYTNASRTLLFNIHTLDWDDELLSVLDIPRCMLPTAVECSGNFGFTDPSFFGIPVPICGIAGDQQSALFGQTCFKPGEIKNTYGTGGFLLVNTGKNPVMSSKGLVTTIACGIGGRVTYALEGSVFVAGAAIQWLRDEMRLIDSADDSEYMAMKVPDTNGCYVVPAFTGLGAPYWDPYARGAIVGLTRGVNKYHIIRATLESLAYQVCDVMEVMHDETGKEIAGLYVDGGASANDLLMQTQADLSGVKVIRPACIETTAMGAAFLAGLACGVFKDLDSLKALRSDAREFIPGISPEERALRMKGWHDAVNRTRS